MKPNQAIVESGYRVLQGRLATPDSSGLCLALTRVVVEDALFDGKWRFYEWRTHLVERLPNAPKDAMGPVARDMERSLREAGMAVAVPRKARHLQPDEMQDLQPGDILFRWDAARWKWGAEPAFYGHVGILMPGELVLENINPAYRAHSFKLGVNALTPLRHYLVTTAVRFDPTKKPRTNS